MRSVLSQQLRGEADDIQHDKGSHVAFYHNEPRCAARSQASPCFFLLDYRPQNWLSFSSHNCPRALLKCEFRRRPFFSSGFIGPSLLYAETLPSPDPLDGFW